MITALDAPPEALDPHERNMVEKIRAHGWVQTSVGAEADAPEFSYTTGFQLTANAPEIIAFSLHPKTVHTILWDVFRGAKAGRNFSEEQRVSDLLQSGDLIFLPVAKRHYPTYLGWSRWLYGGDEFSCLQMIWPDQMGLFPWEQGFDQNYLASQPDLSEAGWHSLS